MNGYPTSEASGAGADGAAAGWYGDQSTDESAQPEQGFSIPTTAQTNGGGPMRQGRGGSRFNPMGRGAKIGGGDMGVPVSAVNAEKNELGFIVFAYNIGYQTTEEQVQQLFSQYGTIAKINVIQDFNTGMNKGYAFITMPNQQEAEAAVNSLNGYAYEGNTLQVRFKTPKGQGPPAGAMRGGRGGFRGGARGGGFRGSPRGGRGGAGGFRGGRGGGRGGGMGGQRGRGRGAYSAAPSAYDGYGYPAAAPSGYEQYGYGAAADPNAYAGYDYTQTAAAADPYAASGYGAAAGSGFTTYGAAGSGAGW